MYNLSSIKISGPVFQKKIILFSRYLEVIDSIQTSGMNWDKIICYFIFSWKVVVLNKKKQTYPAKETIFLKRKAFILSSLLKTLVVSCGIECITNRTELIDYFIWVY